MPRRIHQKFAKGLAAIPLIAVMATLTACSEAAPGDATPKTSPASTSSAHCVGPKTGHPPSGRPNPMRLLRDLNLSDAQSRKIRALVEQGRLENRALYEELKNKRRALVAYLRSENAVETRAIAMNDELQTLQKRLGEKRLKTWFAIREQLTPEQRHKLQKEE